jgi:hypothetical protein
VCTLGSIVVAVYGVVVEDSEKVSCRAIQYERCYLPTFPLSYGSPALVLPSWPEIGSCPEVLPDIVGFVVVVPVV